MKAKQKAWKMFSKYIRLKECIETTGQPELGRCCTCQKYYNIKQLQAGHYIQGRRNAVLYIEDIVHIQCVRCNVFLHGNYHEYRTYMLERYGEEKLKHLENISKLSCKLNHELIYEKYKRLYNKLKETT